MNIDDRHFIAADIENWLRLINWPVNAHEPDYVAKMVDVLPNIITKVLSANLPDRQIKAGGAFIHQKPLAHFINKTGYKDPELGDLLIVCREQRSMGQVYNAMLLQAKRTDTPLSAPIPKDHQFVLYTEWPEFEYKRAGYLNGKTRSVLPKTITQGAQYLLIYETKHVDLLTATVDTPLNASKYFSRTLAAIMSFDAGRTFQVTNPRDDWSQMILDLLRLSAAAVFNRRRSGYIGANRWNGDSAFDYILNPDGQDKDNDKEDLLQYHDVVPDDAHSGMSVICIDLGAAPASGKEPERD